MEQKQQEIREFINFLFKKDCKNKKKMVFFKKRHKKGMTGKEACASFSLEKRKRILFVWKKSNGMKSSR